MLCSNYIPYLTPVVRSPRRTSRERVGSGIDNITLRSRKVILSMGLGTRRYNAITCINPHTCTWVGLAKGDKEVAGMCLQCCGGLSVSSFMKKRFGDRRFIISPASRDCVAYCLRGCGSPCSQPRVPYP